MQTESYPLAISSRTLQDASKLGGAVWLLLLAISRIGSYNGPQFTDAEAAEFLGGISPKLVAQWRDTLARNDYVTAEQKEGDEWSYRVERGRRVFL